MNAPPSVIAPAVYPRSRLASRPRSILVKLGNRATRIWSIQKRIVGPITELTPGTGIDITNSTCALKANASRAPQPLFCSPSVIGAWSACRGDCWCHPGNRQVCKPTSQSTRSTTKATRVLGRACSARQRVVINLQSVAPSPHRRSIDKARLAGATAAKRSRCRGQAGAPGLPSEPAFSGRRAGSGPVCFPRRLALLLGAKAGSSTGPWGEARLPCACSNVGGDCHGKPLGPPLCE